MDKAGDPNPDVPTTYVGNQQIENIKKIIGEKTPDFLAKPIVAGVNMLEKWRGDVSLKIDNKKEEVKVELKILNNGGISPETKAKMNELTKPWKYAEIFFLSLISFIFSHALIFYAIFVVIFILVLRSIWRLIF